MAVELDPLVQVKMENDVEYTTNLALFTNVSNSDELRHLIVQGKIEAALLNACMVRLVSFLFYVVSYHALIVEL